MKFYNVEEFRSNDLEQIRQIIEKKFTVYSVGAFYRLLALKIFSTDIEKIIYLDSDIVVNLDVKELWQIELGDKILAAVPEIFNRSDVQNAFPLVSEGLVKKENYFNSGVLLMNLNFLRNENIIPKWLPVWQENPHYGRFADQDALNYFFSARTVKLSNKFNRFTLYALKANELNLEKKIYHFAGAGLKLDMSDPFNRLWMKYFMRTPFFDVDTMGRLYGGVQQLQVELKQTTINLSAMMSGKTRAFFIAPDAHDALKKIFFIRDDEEIILAKDQTSLQKLLDAMNASRGKKIFFIVLPGFPFQSLIQAGFEYGRDFVNGMDFLSEAHGMPFNSHPLIKAM